MTQERVLITGAGGFVGSQLSADFRDLGWHVTALDRAFGRSVDGVDEVKIDLLDGLPDDFPEVDLVVHGAWMTTDPQTLGLTSKEYVSQNLGLLRPLLLYARRTTPRAFVFLSSSGVFAMDGSGPSLTDGVEPTGFHPYGFAKRGGEMLAMSGFNQDVERHVVRLGYLYGPHETSTESRINVSSVATWLAAAAEGESLDVRDDDPLRDWTYTPDLAGAIGRIAAEPSVGRPVHVCSPHILRDSQMAQLIAEEAGVEVKTILAAGAAKPPLIPSDLDALSDFTWTEPADGIRALWASRDDA